MLSSDFALVDPTTINIKRDQRQRTKIDTKGLKESIQSRGVINPIVVTRDLVLCAGERRLTACLELNIPIPIRYLDTLDVIELQLIELEENLKRSDLHWKDEVQAIALIHQLYEARNPGWTQSATAQAIGLDKSSISAILRVAKDLSNPKIAQAIGWSSAFNLLSRMDDRKTETAISDLLDVGKSLFEGFEQNAAGADLVPTHADAPPTNDNPATPQPTPRAVPVIAPPAMQSILHTTFQAWSSTPSPTKFNFLHCDFPYGINAFDGSLGASGANSTTDMGKGGLELVKSRLYEDKPEIYWELLEHFCSNLDNFMSTSAHIMFWFSMQHYERTLATFRKLAPSLEINPMPLIWVKSDNRGILPDPQRGPRQIYETALFGSREDRKVIRSTSNAYSAPSDKVYHHSTKPEPMLRYFFQMFVDDTTRLLDPTCGSGSALRAAESLGAPLVLGLEANEEHYSSACEALRKFRILRAS